MRVLNIHGYQGSFDNSAYIALQSIGCDIISPQLDYDSEDPEQIIEKLTDLARKNKTNVIVGTSFGGFFAAMVSADLHLPLILVNPCLMPFLHLPRLGYKGDIQPYIKLFSKILLIDPENVSCIVGDSDEVIDTHDFAERLFGNSRFRKILGGKHSGSTLPLKEFFNVIVLHNKDD